MKLYSKIVGLILTLAGFIALAGSVIGVISSYFMNEKIIYGILIVPCIMFLHFMYIHNFGFSLRSEIPQKSYRVILLLTILSLLIAVTIPAGYLLSQIDFQFNKKGVYKISQPLHDLPEVIDRGSYTLNENISCDHIKYITSLKTKYENGNIKYMLKLIPVFKNNPEYYLFNNSRYKIILKDRDGFVIKVLYFHNWEIQKNYNDTNKDSYYTVNLRDKFLYRDYLKINNWTFNCFE